MQSHALAHHGSGPNRGGDRHTRRRQLGEKKGNEINHSGKRIVIKKAKSENSKQGREKNWLGERGGKERKQEKDGIK